jgi:DNA-binding transcriptional LysR family regulator
VESVLVRREAFLVALPKGHALAENDGPLPLDSLTAAAIIGYTASRSASLAPLVGAVLRPVPHEITDRVDEVHTMLALVAAGRGIALVPASARDLGVTGVTFRRLVTEPATPVELRLAWRVGATNPALTAVLPTLLDLCPETLAG